MNFEKLNEAFDRRFSYLNEEDETKEVEKANKLPDACYSVNNTTGEVIIIKNGETGYYPTTYSFKGEKAKEFVKKANKELGVTCAQQHAMEIGSMFGWDVPGADPDNAINKKFNEGLVKNEEPKKFISESLSKEANSSKLSKFFDNFYGTFEFNGDEYRANKKNIKEWIEKHPSYKLLKEDACEYVDDEDIKDYKDGKIYFLKDEKKEVDEKLEVGQSYYLKFGSMEEADDALNKLHDRGFYAEKFDNNSPLVKVVGDDAGRDVTMAVIKELGLEQYVTEGLVDTAVSTVGTLTGHPIAGSIAGGVAQSVVDKLKANKADKTSDIKEAYEGYTHDEVLDDLLDRVRLIKSENEGMSVEDAVERAIDDGLIYNKDILHLAENYGVIDYSELLNNVYDYVFEDLCSVYKDNMMDVDDSFYESLGKKRLTEKKWDYELGDEAVELRSAIEDEDGNRIKSALIACYKKINELVPDDYYNEDDAERDTENLEMSDFVADDYTSDEDAEDNVNFYLNEFYDLCDNLGVWVGF